MPCEPGALAEDKEDGSLTSSVLALPKGVDPEDCLQQDCTPYRLSSKGLKVHMLTIYQPVLGFRVRIQEPKQNPKPLTLNSDET